MKTKNYWIIGLILVVLLGVGYYYFRYHFSLFGDCSRDAVSIVNSPDNIYQAELTIVNCGATTDYVTNVQLKNNQTKAFKDVVIISGKQDEKVKMNWSNKNLLNFNFEGSSDKIFDSVNQFEDVKIELMENGTSIEEK